MQRRILIAEDNLEISDTMRNYLIRAGYVVSQAFDGGDAIEQARRLSPDLILLDIMMPGLSGLELTQKLRERTAMPIMILSARDRDQDKILGLNIGADDYMTKPFNPLEVVARVKALLRRSGTSSDRIRVGCFELDLSNHTVEKDGVQIQLTPMEYKILAKLMKSPGRIYTKVQLYESICGEYFESDDNTIMVHISRIREKIENDPKKPEHLITVRGVGYKFEE